MDGDRRVRRHAIAGLVNAGRRHDRVAWGGGAAAHSRSTGMSRRSCSTQCASCHRPGGIGAVQPADAIDDARQRAPADCAGDDASGVMPPWKPDPGDGGEFVGAPAADRAEIDLIAALGRRAARPKATRATCRRRRVAPTAGSSARRIWSSRLPAVHARRRTAPTSSAIFVIPLPVGPRALRPRHRVPARQRRASCTTPTSASIARGARAGSTTPIRRPATTA